MPTVNHSAKLFAGVVALLNGSGAIAAIVSGRVFSGRAPQGSALPRIVIHEIAGTREHEHDSGTTTDPGLDETVIQLDFDGVTVADARGLADAAAGVLDGYAGDSATCTFGGIWRDSGGFLQGADHDSGNGQAESFRLSVDYRALWRDKL